MNTVITVGVPRNICRVNFTGLTVHVVQFMQTRKHRCDLGIRDCSLEITMHSIHLMDFKMMITVNLHAAEQFCVLLKRWILTRVVCAGREGRVTGHL